MKYMILGGIPLQKFLSVKEILPASYTPEDWLEFIKIESKMRSEEIEMLHKIYGKRKVWEIIGKIIIVSYLLIILIGIVIIIIAGGEF